MKRGISAGRVQSVALRMIVEREYEILAFNKEEYWSFAAHLEGSTKPIFRARLVKWKDETLRQGNKSAKRSIENEAQALEIEETLKKSPFLIQSIKRKAKKQNAPLAYTTSKLQQDASRTLGFTVKKTMMVAQKLYEGIEIKGEPVGLITYMRTDSTRVSEEALTQVRDYITNHFDSAYLPEKARRIKQKANIQDGHEAIRPTKMELTPETLKTHLNRDELRLYALIWRRFVGSQMNPKLMDETVLTIQAGDGLFEAKGLITTFPGYTVLYEKEDTSEDTEKSGDLPKLEEGEVLKVCDLEKTQNFTKPPALYSEASLVKALEENGIGRPSTYASIISTIQNRDYVEKVDSRFHPTELGMVVTELLTKSFPDLMNVSYTAQMENQLDVVESGGRTWQNLLSDFYGNFEVSLKDAEEQMPNMKRDGLSTDLLCETCGKPVVIKTGKYGQFLSCSNYPECTYAKKIKDVDPDTTKVQVLKGMIGKEQERTPPKVEEPCPDCGGELVHKRGRYGEFIACSNYPDCRHIHKQTIGVACLRENCKGNVHVKKSRKGKTFYCCTRYPDCDYVSWDKPTGEACPNCNAPSLYEKKRKKELIHYCENKECQYSRVVEEKETVNASL